MAAKTKRPVGRPKKIKPELEQESLELEEEQSPEITQEITQSDTFPFKFFLRCSACGQIYHETTSKLKLGGPYAGNMFKLIKRYGPTGENWTSFPSDASVMDECLTCPGCECPYVSITQNLYWDKAMKRRVDFDEIGRLLFDKKDKINASEDK